MKETIRKLTILHSNDLHGDFLAEEMDEKLVGGVAMLSGYIDKVRSEEKNVIYAIAGDMFRGSIIDAEYKGISTIEIMNALAPDIVTIGNHEIDYGIPHLLFIEKCAQFPIINANLYIKLNHARLFPPHHILKIDGMKILFIGIITDEILAQAKQDHLIGSFIGVEEAAREVGRICNTYNRIDIDFTVLLTHIGFESDKELAGLLDPDWGVDLIIGGHSHTLLKEPYRVNEVLIAHAGVGTDQIGRFDILVDTDSNSIHSFEWKCVPIDTSHCPVDKHLAELIQKYKNITDQKYARIITRFNRPLTHPQRNSETSLGNLFADIFQESLPCAGWRGRGGRGCRTAQRRRQQHPGQTAVRARVIIMPASGRPHRAANRRLLVQETCQLQIDAPQPALCLPLGQQPQHGLCALWKPCPDGQRRLRQPGGHLAARPHAALGLRLHHRLPALACRPGQLIGKQ